MIESEAKSLANSLESVLLGKLNWFTKGGVIEQLLGSDVPEDEFYTPIEGGKIRASIRYPVGDGRKLVLTYLLRNANAKKAKILTQSDYIDALLGKNEREVDLKDPILSHLRGDETILAVLTETLSTYSLLAELRELNNGFYDMFAHYTPPNPLDLFRKAPILVVPGKERSLEVLSWMIRCSSEQTNPPQHTQARLYGT